MVIGCRLVHDLKIAISRLKQPFFELGNDLLITYGARCLTYRLIALIRKVRVYINKRKLEELIIFTDILLSNLKSLNQFILRVFYKYCRISNQNINVANINTMPFIELLMEKVPKLKL